MNPLVSHLQALLRPSLFDWLLGSTKKTCMVLLLLYADGCQVGNSDLIFVFLSILLHHKETASFHL